MRSTKSREIEEDWNEPEGDDLALPLYVPPEFRNLNATEDKITVRQLWDRYCSNDLILQPDFQRHYVWDDMKASRYIESLLLQLPIPPVFLSEEQDGKWIVIDGHQRLESLFRFIQPLLSGPRKLADDIRLPFGNLNPLKLAHLEILSELNAKGVAALSIEDRDRLWNTPIVIVQLPKTAHPDMKYALFTRLNQGSMSLNSQELRNCLYRGRYNQMLSRLSETSKFLGLWGKTKPDKRMKHRELVLRFFAFLHRRDKYRTPFRAFLNDEMGAGRNLQHQDEEYYEQQFNLAIKWVDRIFGNEVFRQFIMGNQNNPAGQWGRRRYDLIYEIEMVGFAQFGDALEKFWNDAEVKEQQILKLILRNRLAEVMISENFLDSINQGTTRVSAVNARFEPWLNALRSICNNFQEAIEEGEYIQNLMTKSSICAVCPYPVSADDAACLTVKQEERIAHRHCQKINN